MPPRVFNIFHFEKFDFFLPLVFAKMAVVMEILRCSQPVLPGTSSHDALVGLRARIATRICSFVSDVNDMMAKLAWCDIFCMAGIFDVSATWVDRSNCSARRLVEEIQTRAQYKLMASMGV